MRSDSMFVEAAKEDVPEIIALRHQIWGTTYRGIYPDDMIDNFDLGVASGERTAADQ